MTRSVMELNIEHQHEIIVHLTRKSNSHSKFKTYAIHLWEWRL